MVTLDTRAKHELVGLNNDDTEIYRLIEVHHLFELFETKLLTLVAPKLWEDPYENFLEHCYGVVPEEPNTRYVYGSSTKLLFGNCWTLNNDTDATWRIYSPDKRRVKIKTTVSKLYSSIETIKDKFFRSYLGKVDYYQEDEIKTNICNGIREGNFHTKDLVEKFYLKKRETFSAEREIRLLVMLYNPDDGKMINAKYQDCNNLDICRLPIENPEELIDEIVFDPRMPDSLVRAYLAHLTRTFDYKKTCFKSKIYEPPKIAIEIKKKF